MTIIHIPNDKETATIRKMRIAETQNSHKTWTRIAQDKRKKSPKHKKRIIDE